MFPKRAIGLLQGFKYLFSVQLLHPDTFSLFVCRYLSVCLCFWKFVIYKSFKKEFESDSYLTYINIKWFRDVFVQFCPWYYALRYYVPNKEDELNINCPFCDCKEDKHHFLLCCKMYLC